MQAYRTSNLSSSTSCHGCSRRGQALVEFAVVALMMYLLLAAILTFGHALYVAQGLQTAADLAAREISRTPLAADDSFEDVLAAGDLDDIYNDDFLVFDLDTLGGQNFFADIVPTWPAVNQQLAMLMIVDRPDFNGDGTVDRQFIRYPGALLEDASMPAGYTVGFRWSAVERQTAWRRFAGCRWWKRSTQKIRPGIIPETIPIRFKFRHRSAAWWHYELTFHFSRLR